MRRRLTNDNWGLESNCFVCEARNRSGLQLELHADDHRQVVETDFELGSAYSGAPAVVHGGVSLAILDEVQAWAVIALAEQWAVTVETSARFHRPVWVDHRHRAVGRIAQRQADTFTTTGQIIDGEGEICIESTSVFQSVGEATAIAIAGSDLPDEHRHFLRERDPTDRAKRI